MRLQTDDGRLLKESGKRIVLVWTINGGNIERKKMNGSGHVWKHESRGLMIG
jgi:hypothetical protein